MKLVFLLEEPSAKAFLEEFLPRFLPQSVDFQLIPHQGKNDLQKSIPRKLKAWQDKTAVFVILHDKDNHDCQLLKGKLRDICQKARPDVAPLIRIACHELEAWYLGSSISLGKAFPNFKPSTIQSKAKYRDVDLIVDAAEELQRIVPEYQKVSGSRLLGLVFEVEPSNSRSFGAFISGLNRLCQASPAVKRQSRG